MKLTLGYLDPTKESQMLLNLEREHPIETLQPTADGNRLPELARQVWDVHVDETLRDYIVRLVFATRNHVDLLLGASPRGSYALFRGSQALAALKGRDYVLPEDIKRLVPSVLGHRCIVSPESALRGVKIERVLGGILEETPLEIGELS